MESESMDPSLGLNPPSLLTDIHDVSDFNLSDANAAQAIPMPCQRFCRDESGNLQFCFCPRCEQQDLGFSEHPIFPSFVTDNDIAVETQDTAFGSSQLETSGVYWPVLANSQSLSIDTAGEQAVRVEKQRNSRQRFNRVSNIHPTIIVARLHQSLQKDPSCSPKFKSECLKLLDQVKGLMYVEMGRPKLKDSLNISHMQDITSVGRSDSSHSSVGQLANDVFSTTGASDSAPESSPSSKSRSQQSHDRLATEPTTPAPNRAEDRSSRLYQCTYRACTQSFGSKTDWKRHEGSEKHWLQQKYMCLECDTSQIGSTGILECIYCSSSVEDVGDIRTHNLQCDPARKLGRTFTRKDHFRNHLRVDHSMSLTPEASTWVYDIESQWPRQCGFCGYIIDTWARRANHIEEHFRKGYRVSSWRLPFPRVPDPKGKGPRIDSDDSSSNSSASSSSNESVFSAKDRCVVGGVANYGTTAKDMPQNKRLSGNQRGLRNTEEISTYHGVDMINSRNSRDVSRKSTFYQQSANWIILERESLQRCADDDRKFIRSITSRSGKVLVYEHRKRIYDECAPVLVGATSQQFMKTCRRTKGKHPNGLRKFILISHQETKENLPLRTSVTQNGDKRRHEVSKAVPFSFQLERDILDIKPPESQALDIPASYKAIASSTAGSSNDDTSTTAKMHKRARLWHTSERSLRIPQRLTGGNWQIYAIQRYLSDREAPIFLAYLLEQNLKLTESINQPKIQRSISHISRNSSAMSKPSPKFSEMNHLTINSQFEPSGTRTIPGTAFSNLPLESSKSLTDTSLKLEDQAGSTTSSSESSLSRSGYKSSDMEVADMQRSWRSVTSNSQRPSNGSNSSRMSSISSAPSATPPWHDTPMLDRLNYGYDLPCEFSYTGCHLRFHPESSEAWIDHSISHFSRGRPPLRSVCTFCDTHFITADGDRVKKWRQRMLHIGHHFYENRQVDGVEMNHPRPDFHTIEHLKSQGLLSEEDYEWVTRYTERPSCEGLVPLDYKTPEMVREEERSLLVPYDLEKEARQIRKDIRQRKGNSKDGAQLQRPHSIPLNPNEASNVKPSGVISESSNSPARKEVWCGNHEYETSATP